MEDSLEKIITLQTEIKNFQSLIGPEFLPALVTNVM